MRLSFRADIDYLRAIAVIAVIGFHYGVPGFRGGYVGVDVFFVISGYLISRLIWTGLLARRFSFAEFYERRARRLLPALYLTVIVTAGTAWFLAPPDDYRAFFASAVSTVLFSSNIFFWQQAGYFDLPTIGKVLIHTWSLSVEEQFYFMFPVLTLLWAKLFRDPSSKLSLALIVLSIVGLCLLDQHVLKNGSADTAFYLAPLRAWEFLIGTLVYLTQRWSPSDIRLRRALALTGTGLMLLPVIFFAADTPFPGIHAVVPCLGAAAFIMAFNRDGERPALPCERIGLYIGKISYSLYLWHWPVFVLGAAVLPLGWYGSPAATMVRLAASAALASISYHLVEAPVRGRIEWRGVRLSAAIAAMAVVIVAVGSLGMFANGYPQRFAQSQLRLLRYNPVTIAPYYREHTCFLDLNEAFSHYDVESCMTFVPGKKNVVLFGDSTAAHYATALREYLDPDRYNVIQLSSASCPPFVETDQPVPSNCNAVTGAFSKLLDRASAVILSGNWRYYIDALSQPLSQAGRPALTTVFDSYLDRTLSAVAAHHIPMLLIGPSLEFPAPLPATLVRFELTHLPVGDLLKPIHSNFTADDHVRQLAKTYRNVRFVSVLDALCDKSDCRLKADGDTPMLWDSIHLTPEGSRVVLQQIAPALDEVLALARPDTIHLESEARARH
jgi:peptidoglycan/LPS O-acetylase OafA/YrhL